MTNTGMLAEFHALAQQAAALQSEAERLCDEANESGSENNEFEVREQADDMRAAALAVAVKLLAPENNATVTATPDGPEIVKTLILTTGHLPERYGCGDSPEALNTLDGVVAYDIPYGFLMHVPLDDLAHSADQVKESVPAEVFEVMRFAADHDCVYVRFDQDGERVDGLPIWVW